MRTDDQINVHLNGTVRSIMRISKGISEEEAARIFGRFYRGNEVKQEEGIGIGLYLAREIISKEEGYIKVVPNNKRKGGEIVVYLRK